MPASWLSEENSGRLRCAQCVKNFGKVFFSGFTKNSISACDHTIHMQQINWRALPSAL